MIFPCPFPLFSDWLSLHAPIGPEFLGSDWVVKTGVQSTRSKVRYTMQTPPVDKFEFETELAAVNRLELIEVIMMTRTLPRNVSFDDILRIKAWKKDASGRMLKKTEGGMLMVPTDEEVAECIDSYFERMCAPRQIKRPVLDDAMLIKSVKQARIPISSEPTQRMKDIKNWAKASITAYIRLDSHVKFWETFQEDAKAYFFRIAVLRRQVEMAYQATRGFVECSSDRLIGHKQKEEYMDRLCEFGFKNILDPDMGVEVYGTMANMSYDRGMSQLSCIGFFEFTYLVSPKSKTQALRTMRDMDKDRTFNALAPVEYVSWITESKFLREETESELEKSSAKKARHR